MSRITRRRQHKLLIKKIITILVKFWLLVLKQLFTLAGHVLTLLFQKINKRLRFSITFKTASIYTLVFSTILMLLSAILVFAFGLFLFQESQGQLERATKVTQNLLREGGGLPSARLREYAQIEGITITLLDRQKVVTYNSDDYQLSDSAINNPGQYYLTIDQYLHMKTPIRQSEQNYYLILSQSIAGRKAQILLLIVASLGGFGVTVLLTVAIGSRTLKKMLTPIDDMIKTARSVTGTELQTRLNVVDSHDELKELAETFNEMLDRIELAYEQQNQFVSDASHELRTPIAVLQGYANLLQRWGKEDKEVLDEAVQAIKNESENMKSLVEKLLFLARTDRDTQQVEKVTFPLLPLLEEVIKETKLISSEHQILGESAALPAELCILADRALLKQAFRILIENSLKYTPSGGIIKISGSTTEQQVEFTVEDTGIGIAQTDLPLIFNRFYKCDKSRTRGAGGTGLGLSIAKWIIEKHQGTIQASSVLHHGTKITFRLPLA